MVVAVLQTHSSSQPGDQAPHEAPVLPDEMVHRIFDLSDGSDVARAAVNRQWARVGGTRHSLSPPRPAHFFKKPTTPSDRYLGFIAFSLSFA